MNNVSHKKSYVFCTSISYNFLVAKIEIYTYNLANFTKIHHALESMTDA
jgi:hypothetical protein